MNTRDRAVLFRGLVVDIEQFEVEIGNKGWHRFQVVRHPGGVGVVPLHDDGTVTLIRQLRPSIGVSLLEIPAGRLDPGEEPAACGVRELAEETGLTATSLESLGDLLTSPGVFDERIHLFLANGLSQGEAMPEQYEDIATVRLPLAEAVAMAADGRIRDGKTIVALMRAQARQR
ncbi:ADP-ribose pyrophosphatase [Geotalea uraniireducens]|uniref:GDP-mannose pyrophosphatase n=1 Tax=Geotalea uraniireducens TaxID=351604 RepID=A0ABN6VYX8_9BACT|nr:NUDIX hydrolase [Geotalea uraniireducens]BDV44819.1 ADP-ribose pyrophosphatase [Geotalea uraniireducens]